MRQQVPDGILYIIAPALAYARLAIVNAVFYGQPGAGDRRWLLIDAGIPGMAEQIRSATDRRTHHPIPALVAG